MGNEAFPPTHWSQVLAAASPDPERARAAALELCAGYREAIRAWFQRDTRTRQEAEDLAHDFLTRWLVREAPLGRFVRGERRFREFLGGCLRRFATERHRHGAARCRGGGAAHLPIEEDRVPGADGEAAAEGPDLELARQIFREVEAELAARWTPRVPGAGYAGLRDMALGLAAPGDYAARAAALGVPVGTVKGWIFRLRQEFHDGFRGRVARLVEPAELAAELRHLHGLLLRHGP